MISCFKNNQLYRFIAFFIWDSQGSLSSVFPLKLFFFPQGLYGLPKRNGKLKDISHFDASFFGVHPKQANTMDPQLRLILEVAYEAIVDGGKQNINKK